MKAGKRTGSCSWMLFLWGVWVCASCTGGTNSFLMPSSSGNPYEVLVVADPQVWKRPAGRTLWDLLDTDMPGLPQSERAFRIMHADPWDFDATLRLAKNILVLDVDSTKYRRVSFACATDVYAKPQLVVTMQVPDEDSLAAAVAQYGASLLRLFTQAERKRRVEWLADHHGVYVAEQVKELFACDVWVPAELDSYKVGQDFFWAGTHTATADKNFVMYAYPYAGGDAFTKAGFIHKRDSVMKVNVPGARPGMYMATDSLMTDVRLFSLGGDTICEARGLWRVKGDFMGGPFVSHARLDKARHRVVVCEVFVYAPDRMKRNLIRQLEASLYTLRLPEDVQ